MKNETTKNAHTQKYLTINSYDPGVRTAVAFFTGPPLPMTAKLSVFIPPVPSQLMQRKENGRIKYEHFGTSTCSRQMIASIIFPQI